MNFNWIFNGSMGAHHLVAAYVAVWVIQGGYAAWVAWQWTRTRRGIASSADLEPDSRDRT
jgi:hypothetical protein